MNAPVYPSREAMYAALLKSVHDTVEQLMFSEPEETENGSHDLKSLDYFVSVDLSSPFRGEVGIACSHLFAEEFSATVCGGAAGERAAELVKDALCELINTQAGCLLRELVSDAPFGLGLPRFREANLMDADGIKASFQVNAQPLLVVFRIFE